MIKSFFVLASVLAAGLIASTVSAAPTKATAPKTSSKTVTVYQADKCHMYFSAAQAKQYGYACPDSKGKMKKVKVSVAVAKTQLAKTSAELAPKKAM